jgi:hypothetical protein
MAYPSRLQKGMQRFNMRYRLTNEHAYRLRTLDADWVEVISKFGFQIVRNADGWVTYDGRGTIAVVPNSELDTDDTLAQILLHELLHHFVEGPNSYNLPDWGLDNTSEQHVVKEHANLHLQAAVLDLFGLRDILVPTTTFRTYYEQLGNPLYFENHGGCFEEYNQLSQSVTSAFKRLRGHNAFPALAQALERCKSTCASWQLYSPPR